MGLTKEDFELAIKEFGTDTTKILNSLIDLDRNRRIKKTIQEKIILIENMFGKKFVDSTNYDKIIVQLYSGIMNRDLEELFNRENMINYFFRIDLFHRENMIEMILTLRKENIEITKSLLL
jgi:hypothetical protein